MGQRSRAVLHWIIRPGSALILLSWPLLIWLSLRYHLLNWLLPVMVILLVLRLGLTGKKAGPMRGVAQGVVLLALLLSLGSVLLKQYQLLLYYPVLVNLGLLIVFAVSLYSHMPLVERIARWRDPALPDAAVPYTRRVTQLWCLFFIINGAIALATCLYGHVGLWAGWNGMLSYLFMGIVMAGEWLIRQRVIKRLQQ